MKIPQTIVALVVLLLFPSCSTVKQSLTKVKDGTVKTFSAAKDKALSARKPKIRITDADPTKFLPNGTSIDKLASKKQPEKTVAKKKPSSKPAPEKVRLLAKNTTSPPKTQVTPSPRPKPKPIPPLELPPLPEPSEDDNQEFKGILPSLDGSDGATFIDVNGETPELPPMEFIEEDGEEDAEAPA